MSHTGQQARLTRQARREFVRAHHPDVGGDPEVFRQGLQAYGPSAPVGSRVRVVGVRSHRPLVAAALLVWRRRQRRRAAPRVQ